MSYPSDGFESAIRHHIDDVSSVIENWYKIETFHDRNNLPDKLSHFADIFYLFKY